MSEPFFQFTGFMTTLQPVYGGSYGILHLHEIRFMQNSKNWRYSLENFLEFLAIKCLVRIYHRLIPS